MQQIKTVFQYTEPTLTVGNYVFDAIALNAFIRKAVSAYGAGVTYQLQTGAQMTAIQANEDIEPELKLDCSGYAWWSTYRKKLSTHAPGKHWVEIPNPIAGCTVRYDPKPGMTYGHSGVIIYVKPDGSNFESLDCTDATNPPRKGDIRYLTDGKTKWLTKGGPNVKFLVSTDALLSVNGVPHKPEKLNMILAVMKRPMVSAVTGVVLVIGVLSLAAAIWNVSRGNKKDAEDA